MITPEQCRAARGLLKWTQRELANAAGVANQSVRDFELGRKNPQRGTLTLIQQTLEAHGVQFLNGDGPGVRLLKK